MKSEYKKIMSVLRKQKYKRQTTLINALINIKSHGVYIYSNKDDRKILLKLTGQSKTDKTFYTMVKHYYTYRFKEYSAQPGTVTGFGLTKDDLPF